eukprot:Lithocolla_globosa_v1_NODE_8_length_11455_cov_155.660175.p3 type:complete len:384 gc:universal NODE_8_length_11455_cov_155.660175:2171-3322(+)
MVLSSRIAAMVLSSRILVLTLNLLVFFLLISLFLHHLSKSYSAVGLLVGFCVRLVNLLSVRDFPLPINQFSLKLTRSGCFLPVVGVLLALCVVIFDPLSLRGLVESNPGPTGVQALQEQLSVGQERLFESYTQYSDLMATDNPSASTVKKLKHTYEELLHEVTTLKETIKALEPLQTGAASDGAKRTIPSEELPIFRPGSDVHDFMDSFIVALRSYPQITTVDYHLHLLRAVRRGGEVCKPIAAWVSSSLFELTSWELQRASFLARYGGPAAELQALDNVVQFSYRQGETIQNFIDRFVLLCLTAEIDDKDRLAISILRRALPPPIQLEMGRACQDLWPASRNEVLAKVVTVATYSRFKSYSPDKAGVGNTNATVSVNTQAGG